MCVGGRFHAHVGVHGIHGTCEEHVLILAHFIHFHCDTLANVNIDGGLVCTFNNRPVAVWSSSSPPAAPSTGAARGGHFFETGTHGAGSAGDESGSGEGSTSR